MTKQVDLKHFGIAEPLLIGMSGGQTSGYQLRLFLDALGGKITGRRRVCFANTGDEDERTLKFVERISLEWDVDIAWLEYRFVPFPDSLLCNPEFQKLRRDQVACRKDKALRKAVAVMMEDACFPQNAASIRRGRECLNGKHTYDIVNYATASRNKEPYQAALEAREAYRLAVKGLKGVLPCPAQRICTGELKIKTMARYLFDMWGVKPKEYNVALALRADEMHRVDSAMAADVDSGIPYFPMADAGIVGADVVGFWNSQPFRLGMKSYEGNCGRCFMKKKHALSRLIHRDPSSADWWIGWEKRTEDRFRRDRDSYAAMQYAAIHQMEIFPEPEETESVITCEGGYCSD